jgi:hypothetical protein
MPQLLINELTPTVQLDIEESSQDTEIGPEQTLSSVMEQTTEILGYDIFALESDGYVEMGEESLALAESNLAASVETLPSE